MPWNPTVCQARIMSCVYACAWTSVSLCLCIEIQIKDIMRDRSCITQLGQSSRGAAGSSSRQMENVLVPLHAWTYSTPSAASTARNLANLLHNFKGTWFREPVNLAGLGRTAQIEPFCLKNVCFPKPGYTFATVPATNEVERRSSASQFVLHIFHLLKFYSHPKVPIHRARIPAYIFSLCHLQSSRTPRPNFSTGVLPVYSCSGKTVQSGLNLKVREGY